MKTKQHHCIISDLTIIARLIPSTWLSIGEPKQDAMAISGFPALETTVSATQSAAQLPSANTVSPSIAKIFNNSTCKTEKKH